MTEFVYGLVVATFLSLVLVPWRSERTYKRAVSVLIFSILIFLWSAVAATALWKIVAKAVGM